MRAIRFSFLHMIRFLRQDMMLLAALLSTPLMGIAIRFGIPAMERLLEKITGRPQLLAPYYGLFDIFFSSIVPVIFCFISAMVMLEERDDHIDRYLFITGLGKRGYYISRIVIPAFGALAVTVILLPIFELTDLSFLEIFFLALAGTLQGIIIALMVISLSSNKLEGMAITKLSSLLMLGALGPYLMPAPLYFILFFMPSFWTGMAIYEKNCLFMLPSLIAAGMWIFVHEKLIAPD